MKQHTLNTWKQLVRDALVNKEFDTAQTLIDSHANRFRQEVEFQQYTKVLEAFKLCYIDGDYDKAIFTLKEPYDVLQYDVFVSGYYLNFLGEQALRRGEREKAYEYHYRAKEYLPEGKRILANLTISLVEYIYHLQLGGEHKKAILKIFELKRLGYPLHRSLPDILCVLSQRTKNYDVAIMLLTDATKLNKEDGKYAALLTVAKARKMIFSCTLSNYATTFNQELYSDACEQADIHRCFGVLRSADYYLKAVKHYTIPHLNDAMEAILLAHKYEPDNNEINAFKTQLTQEFEQEIQNYSSELERLCKKSFTIGIRNEITCTATTLFNMMITIKNVEKAAHYSEIITIYENGLYVLISESNCHYMLNCTYQELAQNAFAAGDDDKAIEYCYKINDQNMLKPLHNSIFSCIGGKNDLAAQLLANQRELVFNNYPGYLWQIDLSRNVKSLCITQTLCCTPNTLLKAMKSWIWLEHLSLNLAACNAIDIQNFIFELLKHPSLVTIDLMLPTMRIRDAISEKFATSRNVINQLTLRATNTEEVFVLQRQDVKPLWKQMKKTLPTSLGATTIPCLKLHHMWKCMSKDEAEKARFAKLVSESSELTLCLLASELTSELIPMILNKITDYELLQSALPKAKSV